MAEEPGHRMGELLETSQPSFRTVMSCVFGIEEHETRTYLALLERPGSTVEELTAVLDRERSTVNRTLSTLVERNLVRRDRRLLDSGGYVYQYTATDLPEAKEMMHESLEEWVEHVKHTIEDFEDG